MVHPTGQWYIGPGLSGKDLFEQLREINPRVRILLTSGYNQDASIDALIDAGAAADLFCLAGLGRLKALAAGPGAASATALLIAAARVGARASSTALRSAPCSARPSRKRTSIFVGCTFTSTSSGAMVMKIA